MLKQQRTFSCGFLKCCSVSKMLPFFFFQTQRSKYCYLKISKSLQSCTNSNSLSLSVLTSRPWHMQSTWLRKEQKAPVCRAIAPLSILQKQAQSDSARQTKQDLCTAQRPAWNSLTLSKGEWCILFNKVMGQWKPEHESNRLKQAVWNALSMLFQLSWFSKSDY